MKSRNTFFSLLILALFFVFCGPAQGADALIEKVIYQEENGTSASVAFHLNGPYLPKVFALKGDKPRVVFDFQGTQPAKTVPAVISPEGTMVKSIRVGRHSEKTRVVIDLVPGGEYHFDQDFDKADNILTILLYPAGALAQQKAAPQVDSSVASEKTESVQAAVPAVKADPEVVPAKPPEIVDEGKTEATEVSLDPPQDPVPTEPAEGTEEAGGPVPDALLSEVSFENTSNNGEMALFKLNGFYPPTVSGEEEGTPRVICDFPGTRLADGVIKDMSTHGKYVDRIRVEQLAEPLRVQVTLELIPNKNYDLQQVFFKEDNLFVIIVNSYDALDENQSPGN